MSATTMPEVATKASAVSVQNVRKVYQRDSQQLTVLDGINLEVPAANSWRSWDRRARARPRC